jgi:hypothetical protein
MRNPPEGYVVLPTSTTYTNLSTELNKWETAIPSLPDPDGKFHIYVTEKELTMYLRELSYSTR